MPTPLVHALTLPQWGMQAVRAPTSTPDAATVTATKKIAIKDLLIRPLDAISRDESPLKGLSVRNRGGEVVMFRGTEWEVPETPYFFDEAHYWAAMAIKGGVTCCTTISTWTYTLDPTLVATRDLRTIEVNMSDGAGGTADFAIPNCFLQEIEFSGSPESPVRFSAKGMGRRQTIEARTGGLALFPLIGVGSPLSSVFIDPSWATRGTTTVTGQIIGWRFKLQTGLASQFTTDGRADLDFGMVIHNPEECNWTIEMDFKALGSSDIWRTERTAAEAATLRAVEIRLDNGALYQTKLQALVKHSQASVFPTDRQNGEVTGKFVFESTTDDTNALALVIKNTQVAAVA